MTDGPAAWLPSAAGWHWLLLHRDDLRRACPLVWIVDHRAPAQWLAEARAWLLSTGRRGGIVGVRCCASPILGLFFFRIGPARGEPRLSVERAWLVEPVGTHRTLAAVLRAMREVADVHACREVRIHRRAGSFLSAEGMADIGVRAGFIRDGRSWRLDRSIAGKVVLLRPGPMLPRH